MKKSELASNIFSKFGSVKRARGCFLYTAKNIRLTDLCQEGGRAILGWGSEGTSAFTIFKNVLSRGITGTFQTEFSHRLEKAVSELFDSERNTYVFLKKIDAELFAKSVCGQFAEYKPWFSSEKSFPEENVILFEPPLPWTNSIYIVAVKKNLNGQKPETEEDFCFSAPLLAAVTRSVYDLIGAIQARSEKDFFIYDKILTKYWIRKGPYLFPKVPESKYSDFVLHCLDCELVISPDYEIPSIVPFGADKGNFRKLEKNPFGD